MLELSEIPRLALSLQLTKDQLVTTHEDWTVGDLRAALAGVNAALPIRISVPLSPDPDDAPLGGQWSLIDAEAETPAVQPTGYVRTARGFILYIDHTPAAGGARPSDCL